MTYSCCKIGFLNVDIDADTSKLQAKEERNSMSGRLRGISQSKTHFTDYFFIQLSKAVFLNPKHMPQRLFSSFKIIKSYLYSGIA